MPGPALAVTHRLMAIQVCTVQPFDDLAAVDRVMKDAFEIDIAFCHFSPPDEQASKMPAPRAKINYKIHVNHRFLESILGN